MEGENGLNRVIGRSTKKGRGVTGRGTETGTTGCWIKDVSR